MMYGKKQRILSLVSAGVFIAALAVSSVHVCVSSRGTKRRVLYFHTFDSPSLVTEVRRMGAGAPQGNEAAFVDELLLGPSTYRYKRLFPEGTERDFCFARGGVLYVGLSVRALEAGHDTDGVKEGVSLLKKNIRRNFSGIKKVEVFIDGRPAYPDARR